MTEARATRKLAAILVADAVGYSRLMGEDETGTLSQIKNHFKEVFEPTIGAHDGRIVKTMGDGLLAEFASAVRAVEGAVELQLAMTKRAIDVPESRRVIFRIGINTGDIIVEGDDIYGDAVNIAARLQGLAEPGGICISRSVQEQVEGKLDLDFQDMGGQEVKNIAKPVRAFLVELPGVKRTIPGTRGSSPQLHQEIRFCTASDNIQIAYATAGEGPTLVKTANWLNHLEFDWESPIWRHVLHSLAEKHTLVRYDQRGTGLSDWDVEDISFEAWVRDLETVVDVAGLERFAILGISQGCGVAIEYAVRHPERVSRLVLYGGYARGRNKRGAPDQVEQDEAMIRLIEIGWGQDNPAFRQAFTSLMVPDASPVQMDWFNELQRRTATPENAVRVRHTQNDIDVTDQLGRISVPTLVLHVRDDSIVPFEEGRRMAAMIPGARFVALEGRNHLILEDEPAWPRFQQEVRNFLNQDTGEV